MKILCITLRIICSYVMIFFLCCIGFAEDRKVHELSPTFDFEHPKGHFTDGLTFSSDSIFFATTGDSGRRGVGIIDIFNINSGEIIKSIDVTPNAFAMICSPDGQKIYRVTLDKKLRIYKAPKWDIEDEIVVPGKTPMKLSVSPDGKSLVTAAYQGILVWDLKTNTSTAVESQGEGITEIEFSTDGKEFAAAYSGSRTVEVFRLGETKPVRVLEGKEGVFLSVRYSPDMKTIATGFSKLLGKDEQATPVLLWDAATGKLLRKCEGPTTLRQSNDFTKDSKYVLSLSNQMEGYPGVLSVWEVQSGKLIYQWKTDKPCVTFALSPDNTSLVTCDQDGKLQRWDFETIRKQFDKK